MSEDERYRTFWPRFGAAFVDSLVFMPVGWLDEWVWTNVSSGPVLVAWYVVISFSMVSYSILLHGYCGQTLGKMAANVIVVDVAGSRLTYRQALARDAVPLVLIVCALLMDLPRVASGWNPYEAALVADLADPEFWLLWASVGWTALELVTMLTNRRRRALHDFIAGSVVVRKAFVTDVEQGA